LELEQTHALVAKEEGRREERGREEKHRREGEAEVKPEATGGDVSINL
jgi:hypothetical protein